MRIKLICVGSLKEKYLKEACGEYMKRLGPYAKVFVTEVRDEDDSRPDALESEGDRILKNIRSGEYVITLEISGDIITSEGLAKKITGLGIKGISDITFVIGGSRGLHDKVRQRSDSSLSLSRMTLPHQLARVVLLEQIYRAYMINTGRKYHK